MIRITATCDHEGCDATVVLSDDDEQPVCGENFRAVDKPDVPRCHLVVDTSWLGLPAGWQLSEDSIAVIYCPQHAPTA